MVTAGTRPPVSAGEPAPDFALPGIDRHEPVSLADYRGKSLLALLLGLWGPFCRRQIAQPGEMEGKLKASGVESLGVVATPPENARLYFRFRPTRCGSPPTPSSRRTAPTACRSRIRRRSLWTRCKRRGSTPTAIYRSRYRSSKRLHASQSSMATWRMRPIGPIRSGSGLNSKPSF